MQNLQMQITRGTQNRPPRIIIIGEPKIGKSTWAACAANPVILPVKGEEGVDALDVDKLPVANTFADALAALTWLAGAEHDYKTAVIDSVSALEPLVWAETCREEEWANIEKPGFGKGYVAALSRWGEIMTALDALRARGMASILIGHAKVKTVSTPDTEPYDSWVFDINDRAASLLSRWADFVGFAGRRITVNGGDTAKEKVAVDRGRYLFTQRTATHPGGGRGLYGRLPDVLPLDYGAFRAAYAELLAAQKRAREEMEAAQKAEAEAANTAEPSTATTEN